MKIQFLKPITYQKLYLEKEWGLQKRRKLSTWAREWSFLTGEGLAPQPGWVRVALLFSLLHFGDLAYVFLFLKKEHVFLLNTTLSCTHLHPLFYMLEAKGQGG